MVRRMFVVSDDWQAFGLRGSKLCKEEIEQIHLYILNLAWS
ncbi:MAG: hypothetical protein AAFY50_25670 [Cyanobacteria bacterium J06648_1]